MARYLTRLAYRYPSPIDFYAAILRDIRSHKRSLLNALFTNIVVFAFLVSPFTQTIYPSDTSPSGAQSHVGTLGSTASAALPPAIAPSNVHPASGPTFPNDQGASFAYNLTGVWNTRAWTNPEYSPSLDFTGIITLTQRGQDLAGTFTITGCPSPTGSFTGTIDDQGQVTLYYTVQTYCYGLSGQTVHANVIQSGLIIYGDWTAPGLAGEYYAFNQQVNPRPVGQSFGSPGDICGHEQACAQSLDPVNLATGNAVWQETDLDVPAPGRPFVWWRTYNSRDTISRALGQGWSLSYDARLDLSVQGQVTVIAENGAQSTYVLSDYQYLRPQAELADLEYDQANSVYRLIRPDQSVLVFSNQGKLLSKSDTAGRTITLSYNNGALSHITDALGRRYDIVTDGQGRIKQLTDTTLQRSVVYTYTGPLLSDVRDVLSHTTHYDYDANNRLTVVTLNDGSQRVHNQYDSLGRLTWQDSWNSTPFTVTYDVAVSPITETVVLTGNKTVVVSRPVTRTLVLDSANTTTAYDHDQGGRLLRTVQLLGQPGETSTINYFNGNDEQVQSRDPLQNVTTNNYDANGNLLSQRDATGAGKDYAYDSLNRLISERDTLNHTTAYTYTAEGLLHQSANALGKLDTYTYTLVPIPGSGSVRLLTAQENALGRVTSFSYDTQGQLSQITYPLGVTSTLQYDPAGRLTRVIDATGVAECREYDAADHLTAVVRNCVTGGPSTNDQNVRTEYGYDLLGRQIWERNPLGEVTRTFYDEGGRVSKVVAGCALNGVPSTTTCDPFTSAAPNLNRTTSYGYDPLGRQVVVTDTLGILTHIDYDALSRPIRGIRNYRPDLPSDMTTNITTTLEYDAVGRVITGTEVLGRRTVYSYDAAGRVTQQTLNYADGNPSTGTDDTDLVTRTEYDGVGQPMTTTANYVDGVYDPSHPDEDLKAVTLYDELNRPQFQVQNYVDGISGQGEVDTDRITEYHYDDVGNLAYTIDPFGRASVVLYDELNRAVEQILNCTDGSGNRRTSNCATGHGANNDENISSSMTYTRRSQLESTTDPLGKRTLIHYDPLGRVVEQVANEGGSVPPFDVPTHYAYDALGNTVVITDALTGTVRYEYNSAGWLEQQYDQTNIPANFQYDGLGRQVIQSDVLGRVAHTIYDALGRPFKQVANWQNGVPDPNDPPDVDLVTETVYDAASRQVAQIAPDGKRTNYVLDNLDQITSVVENASGSVLPANVTTTLTYDRRGLLKTITDALSRPPRLLSYNAAGWMVSSTDPLSRTTSYTYDVGGRQRTVTDPRPVTITNTYDLLDRTTGITGPGLTPIVFAYDTGSRRTSMTDATGTTSYTYDGLDRMKEVAHSTDGTVTIVYDPLGRRTSLSTDNGMPPLSYTYDAAGRLGEVKKSGITYASAITDTLGRLQSVSRANGATTTYTYDGVDRVTRLTTAVGANTRADFSYDLNRAGQVTVVTETLGLNTRSVDYTYDGLNRLTSAREAPGSKYEYGYDLVGNRTQVKVNGAVNETRSYDAADQVVGWQYDGAGNLLQDGSSTYTYDALKRLAQVDRTPGQTYIYTYNGDNVLEGEQRTGPFSWIITYFTLDSTGDGGLPERLGAKVNGGTSSWYVRGWGQELSRENLAGKSNTVRWYLADRLGSVRGEMDNAGSLSTTYDYDPFGTPEGNTSPQDYGFTGEPQNSFLQQVYLRARWYSTERGRFGTRDPIIGWASQPMSMHPYMYVYDDPINGTDPTGEQTCRPSPGVRCAGPIPVPVPQPPDWGQIAQNICNLTGFMCSSKYDYDWTERLADIWADAGRGLERVRDWCTAPFQAPPVVGPLTQPKTLPDTAYKNPKPQPAPSPLPVPVLPPQPAPQRQPTATPTPNRGRIQIQGSDILGMPGAVRDTISWPWYRTAPVPASEGIQELDNLWNRLSRTQKAVRNIAYINASNYIRNAPAARGVWAPTRRTFQNPPGQRGTGTTARTARIDVDVLQGVAFDVP